MRTRAPLTRVVVVALAMAGLAGLAGCEPVSGSPSTITIRYQERAPLTRDRLVVTISDGRNEWHYEGLDLEPDDDGWLVSRPLRLTNTSIIRLGVGFRGSGPSAVATGDVVIATGSRERWTVDIFAASSGGETACAGCGGISRFTIAQDSRPTARDWLYVRWSAASQDPTAP